MIFRRIAASAIDLFLVNICLFFFIFIFNLVSLVFPESISPIPSNFDVIFRFPLPIVTYYSICFGYWKKTLGMKLLDLSLYPDNVRNISFKNILIRTFVFWELFALTINFGLYLLFNTTLDFILTSSLNPYYLFFGITFLISIPTLSILVLLYSDGKLSLADLISYTNTAYMRIKLTSYANKTKILKHSFLLTLCLSAMLTACMRLTYVPISFYLNKYTVSTTLLNLFNYQESHNFKNIGMFANPYEGVARTNRKLEDPDSIIPPRTKCLKITFSSLLKEKHFRKTLARIINHVIIEHRSELHSGKVIELNYQRQTQRAGFTMQSILPIWIKYSNGQYLVQEGTSVAGIAMLSLFPSPLKCFSFSEKLYDFVAESLGLADPIRHPFSLLS